MSTTRGRAPLLLMLLLLVGACSSGSQVQEVTEDADTGYFDASALAGETVTLTGKVDEELAGGAFRLTGDEFGADGLTVVAPGGASAAGTVARVTGTITDNDLAELDAEFVVAADHVEALVPQADGEESVPAAAEDLAAALQRRAGDFAALLAGTLEDAGPYTVFAPEDEALAGQAATLLTEPGRLEAVLRHHVVEGEYSTADLVEVDTLTTLAGTELDVSTADGQVLVGGQPIVEPDLDVAGGVAHVIGGVLEPPAP